MTCRFYHWHKWKAVSAQNRKQPVMLHNVFPVDGVFEPMTDILFRCDLCGKIKEESIHGTWTLEQMRGECVEDKRP